MTQRLVILVTAFAAAMALEAQPSPAPPAAAPAAAARSGQGEGAGSTIFGDHCLTCHGKVAGAPTYNAMRAMTSDRILGSLTSGSVKAHAEEVTKMTDQQMRDIAEWISERRLGGEHEEA